MLWLQLRARTLAASLHAEDGLAALRLTGRVAHAERVEHRRADRRDYRHRFGIRKLVNNNRDHCDRIFSHLRIDV